MRPARVMTAQFWTQIAHKGVSHSRRHSARHGLASDWPHLEDTPPVSVTRDCTRFGAKLS